MNDCPRVQWCCLSQVLRIMSYCKRDGKDTSIFVTQEDSSNPETVTTLAQDEEYGIVLPSGELNWDCPCLGGMAYGPCGQEFKDAFSCFHYSNVEEKGSDCIPQFKTMQECFQEHPEVYSKYSDMEDKELSENTTSETLVTNSNNRESESIKSEDASLQETAQ